MKRVHTVLLVLAVGGVLAACDRSRDEARDDAIEAQQQANQEIREAQQEAAKTATEVRNEAQEEQAQRDEKVAEANQEAREKSAEAQAEANEDIRAANTDMKKTAAGTQLQTWAQSKVDELSNEIDAATVKAQTASSTARARFENDMKEVRQDRDELVAELSALETRLGQNAAQFRATVDQRITRLKDRVDALEERL